MSGSPARLPPGPAVILCADDFAISEGVSAGIEELADAGRLSAASAMVTFPEWPRLAPRLARLRERVAIGLHINLTVGMPLTAMRLHPNGELPSIGELILAGARGAISVAEVAAEAGRQLDHFAEHAGCLPDFVDGHQHVHVLPGVRAGVLTALRRLSGRGLLVRDPSDPIVRIVQRGVCVAKALQVVGLASGFGKAARAQGLFTNQGFSGFSAFDPNSPYARELEAGLSHSGPLHLMMCHPGHADAVLAQRDPVTERREQEFAALMSAEGLRERLWRPHRDAPQLWEADRG